MAYQNAECIDEIIVVAKKEEIPEWERLCKAQCIPKLSKIIAGGSTRQMSVMNGIDAVSKKYDFIPNLYSRTKPVMLSELMSYTHITGVYSYFTGEANINVAFPDFTIPYTAAHELAHQRGMAREDEANFIAFLVCLESDDPYIRYSGYVMTLEYLLDAHYLGDTSENHSAYRELYLTLSENVRAEQKAYYEFFQKYDDNIVADVSGAVNDAYLQSQGTPGRVSYGLVVDLAVKYYSKQG